jgi:hypothetical protein
VPVLAGCAVPAVVGTLVVAGVVVAAATVGAGVSLDIGLGAPARGAQATAATVAAPSNIALMTNLISACLPVCVAPLCAAGKTPSATGAFASKPSPAVDRQG